MRMYRNGLLLFVSLLAAGCSTGTTVNTASDHQTGPSVKTREIRKPLHMHSIQSKQRQWPSGESPLPKAIRLNVPIIAQNPELKYGCEVTSLAMVLQYAGIHVNKMKLADQISKDTAPLKQNKTGDITHWGNPNVGFVGDITGKSAGYAVYAKPLLQLMDKYLPGRAVDLTNKPFDTLLRQVSRRKPVIVWTTGNFQAPARWESWQHDNRQIHATLDLHAVVLVGYEANFVLINDPLKVHQFRRVDKQQFVESWKALGRQAISYM